MRERSSSRPSNGQKRSPTDKGREFEQDVDEVLRLKGYVVSRDVKVAGTQVDMLASKSDQLENLRLVVECCDRVEPVGVPLVKEKASVLRPLERDRRWLYRLLMVSRSGFTNEAKEYAGEVPGIKLMTKDELDATVVDYGPYVDWYLLNYAASTDIFQEGALSETYIPLSARGPEEQFVSDLDAEVRHWL
jgi:hypothetical protein